MSNINAAIGERVHRVMWKRRITQSALAEHLGMSQSAISRKLHGDRPWDADDIIHVADALGLTLDWLFFGDGETPDPEGSNGSAPGVGIEPTTCGLQLLHSGSGLELVAA